MTDYKTPHFLTERLVIRVLTLDDVQAFYEYHVLPEVSQYQGWRPRQLSDAEEFLHENTQVAVNTPHAWLQMAVCLKDGAMIGDVGIHFLDEFHAEVGYSLSPTYQGKGYAIEAVRAVVNYLFVDLKKHRVTASVDPNNTSSITLLEKLGFRKEAHFIKSFRMDDRWADDCIYAMLEEEWR
jgi:RimJ/RimL family protein N-acetyltransferase